MTNTFEFEILPDGKIKLTTGSFSGELHLDADELLAEIVDIAGGERVTTKRPRPQAQQAHHSHEHRHVRH